MKKRSLAVALMCCVFALALGLAGCGGGGGTSASKSSAAPDPVAESQMAFTGTWDLTGMSEDGEEMSSDDIDLLRELGLDVYLELNEDGTAALVLFGDTMDGTWTPKTAETATVTLEGQEIEMTLDDGTLTVEQDDAKLEFMVGEPHTGDSSASSGLDGDIVEVDATTIADDDLAKIVVTGMMVDSYNDPGYVLDVTNKSDVPIYVTVGEESFTVNGKLIDPILGETFDVGEAGQVFMYFDHEELGSSELSALAAVEGNLEVWDDDTLETLGQYAFQM